MSNLSSTSVIVDSSKELPTEILLQLIGQVDKYQATDLHIVPRGFQREGRGPARLWYRFQGKMLLAKDWEGFTDTHGNLMPEMSVAMFKDSFFRGEAEGVVMKVIRTGKRQIRVKFLRTKGGERLLLRFQPKTPPPIAESFKTTPNIVEALRSATGLVVVCGRQGAGKSTLATSIVDLWANSERHIATIEDPVEYILDPSMGVVSHVEACFHRPGINGSTALDEAIREAMTSDIDGLFIGEIRTGRDMMRALNACGAKEPVVLTLHSRSILDALLRMLNLVNEHVEDEIARRTLSQCLEMILYVDLAYTKDGKPVPVIMTASFNSPSIRKNISEGTRSNMIQALTSAIEQGASAGTVRREAAVGNARALFATEESIKNALPPMT